jgi:hypothetical protein
MHRLILGLGLALATLAAQADGVENKWRLEFSGNAESAGRIVLELAPAQGEPVRASVDIARGLGENAVAAAVRAALQSQAGQRYAVETDDGEDVLVKKQDGQQDFVITVVENTVQGVRLEIDSE